MDELKTIRLTKREIEKILTTLQYSISRELEFLQDNKDAPDSEPFVIFLESIQDQTEIYIKLAEVINQPAEIEE